MLAFFHIILFVFWLEGDLGVAILGEHFRKRKTYSVQERLTILNCSLLMTLTLAMLGPSVRRHIKWHRFGPSQRTFSLRRFYKVCARPKFENVTLTVTGPNGFHAKGFSKLSAPFVYLAENGDIEDGLYYWQLTGSTNKQIKANPMKLNNGRGDREREFTFESASESGTFRVSGGVIVPLDSTIEDSSLR